MIAIILNTKSFPSKDGKQLHVVELSNQDTVFVAEEEFKSYKVGQTVFVNTKKYKKDDKWKTTKSLLPITIG